ncbi:glycosyltransferase [Patulibacter sp.]|uniref:glycosyltransferase n=1 Tax=Patulibacter sp. TaxID=1912859 RepID=UPI002726F916|nr:glycosyltransferase [Patulibacter sp.]MDO9407144.1 glycosyltransferase [Patulibacter sp.]
MHVLVVSNMAPDAEHPERGGFVRDQVAALRRIDGLEVAFDEFAPGDYRAAAARLHHRHRGRRYDVVHSHFGLTAVPALVVRARLRGVTLHGRDLRHRTTRPVTLAVLPSQRLIGLASPDLASMVPAVLRRRTAPLPVGLELGRFGPLPRADARRELGLDPDERFLLFPYGPDRRVKRVDRARELAEAAGLPLRTLGGAPPERMRAWLNAATAVVIPSEHEGFGLAAVEALACDVPVLATRTGAHAETVGAVDGCLCAEWDLPRWLRALRPHLEEEDPRVAGRTVAERHGTDAYAALLAAAWRRTLG